MAFALAWDQYAALSHSKERFVECAIEYGFLGISGEVTIGVKRECMRKRLAADCEGAGIEDLDGTVCDGSLYLRDLLCSARSRDGFIERSHDDSAVCHALAPILRDLLAIHVCLDGLIEVDCPVDPRRDEGCGRSDACHIVVVSGVEYAA